MQILLLLLFDGLTKAAERKTREAHEIASGDKYTYLRPVGTERKHESAGNAGAWRQAFCRR